MEIIKSDLFFEIINKFKYVPFTQSYAWYSYCNCDVVGRSICLVDDVNNPQIACFCHVKKALGFSMLLVEGECLNSTDYSNSSITSFYKDLGKLPYSIIELNSASVYNPEFEIGIRRAGYLRPVGLFSTPLTIIVPLEETVQYNRNWSRNLKKSDLHNLTFEIIDKPNVVDCKCFVETYNKLSDYKGFINKLKADDLLKLLCDTSMKFFVVKDKTGVVLCYRIVHIYNKLATDVFAANTLESRDVSATHFMMDTLFLYLKEEGVLFFDFARISPGRKNSDSVFLFKNGVHGTKQLYNGEWSKYKKSIYRPLMYLVKRFLFKRNEV